MRPCSASLPGAKASIRIGIAAALLLLAGLCFADSPEDLFTSGKKAFADGLYSMAITSFQRIVDEFPESPRAAEAAYMAGVCLYYSGKWDEAAASLAELRARRPDSALASRAAYWQGACCIKIGRFEKAIELLKEQAAQGEGTYHQSAVLLTGAAQEALGRDKEAAALYRKLLASQLPAVAEAEATFRLAGTEYRAGRFASARDLYQKILINHPQSGFAGESAFCMAECELSLGNLAEAEKRYGTVISLYKDSPFREASLFRMADISQRSKRIEQALKRLDALKAQFPDGVYQARAMMLRGDILFDSKKYDDALSAYQRALQGLKEGAERQSAFYAIGLSHLMKGGKSEAVSFFDKARTGPDQSICRKAGLQFSLLLAESGKTEQAISALQPLVDSGETGPEAEDALRLQASLLDRQGDGERSFKRWDALVKGYPSSARIAEHLFRRGTAALKTGNSVAALDDFQRIVKSFPSSQWRGESQYSIGYIYSQRGEFTRALPFFQAALKTEPKGDLAERSRLSIGICQFNAGAFSKALETFDALQSSAAKGANQGIVALYAGRALYRSERLDEAAERLTLAAQLLGKDPSGADALYWLAWSFFRLNKLLQARNTFLSIPESFPSDARNAEAFFRAGICETLRAEDEAAIGCFDRALAASSTAAMTDIHEQALYERGWALSRRGMAAESAAAFERLAREHPGSHLAAEAFFKTGSRAQSEKRWTDAREGFQRVIDGFPKSALVGQARYQLAQVSLESGDAERAARELWSLLASGPDAGLLQISLDGLQKAVRAANSTDLARELVEKSKTTRGLPVEAKARIRLDYAEMLLPDRHADALPILLDVKRMSPPEPLAGEAGLLLGRCYAVAGDSRRALDIFAALAGSRADAIGAAAKLERGRCLEATGRTVEAIEEYLGVSYVFPDFADPAAEGLFNAARVAFQRGDRDKTRIIGDRLRKEYAESPWIGKLDALK